MILNGSQMTLFADDILLYREIKCPGDYAYVQSAVVGTFGSTWEYATFHVHQTLAIQVFSLTQAVCKCISLNVRPILDYAAPVWDPYYITHIQEK